MAPESNGREMFSKSMCCCISLVYLRCNKFCWMKDPNRWFAVVSITKDEELVTHCDCTTKTMYMWNR